MHFWSKLIIISAIVLALLLLAGVSLGHAQTPVSPAEAQTSTSTPSSSSSQAPSPQAPVEASSSSQTEPPANTGLRLHSHAEPLPQSPRPHAPPANVYHPRPNETYLYHAGVFCGLGASTSAVSTKPSGGCGAGLTFFPTLLFVEVGILAPQANRSYLSGYVSMDATVPLASPQGKYMPFALAGYSRFFETGHSLDYGVGVAMPRWGHPQDFSSLRLELRDYWTFANPTQHNVMLRIGWMSVAAD